MIFSTSCLYVWYKKKAHQNTPSNITKSDFPCLFRFFPPIFPLKWHTLGSLTGWWYTYPSEEYWSTGIWADEIPNWTEQQNSSSSHHQPVISSQPTFLSSQLATFDTGPWGFQSSQVSAEMRQLIGTPGQRWGLRRLQATEEAPRDLHPEDRRGSDWSLVYLPLEYTYGHGSKPWYPSEHQNRW